MKTNELLEQPIAAEPIERAGYKLTKLGWLPEEWEVVRVNDVARMGTGHTPDKKVDGHYNGGIKWVSLQDSHRLDKRYIDQTTIEISEAGIRNSSAVMHPANTVILLRDAGVGKSALLAEPMAVSQHFIAWVCGPVVDPEFLYYSLQRQKPYFEQQANGSTIKTLGMPFFERLEIALPTIDEQQEIVRRLIAWDASIDEQARLIATKTDYKRGLMQQLLTGRRRFAEFEGLPLNIEKLRPYLREITERNKAGKASRILSVTNSRGFIDQRDQFEREVASEDRSNYKVVRRGQFGYNPSRINVGSIDLLERFENGILSPLYIIFETAAERLNAHYLRHFFGTDSFQQQMKHLVQGSVRDSLPFDGMCEIKLFIPSLKEQGCIAAVLTACDRELDLLRAQLAQLQEQKKGLMQVLLTGQVRINKTTTS